MVQQPGGASQISFGSYEPSPQRVRRAVEPKPWGTDEATEAAAPQPLMVRPAANPLPALEIHVLLTAPTAAKPLCTASGTAPTERLLQRLLEGALVLVIEAGLLAYPQTCFVSIRHLPDVFCMACARQQQQMQAEEPEAAPVANEKDFQRMTLQEVRVILRQMNLNVGGSKEVLIARYFDAFNAGEVKAHKVRVGSPFAFTAPPRSWRSYSDSHENTRRPFFLSSLEAAVA